MAIRVLFLLTLGLCAFASLTATLMLSPHAMPSSAQALCLAAPEPVGDMRAAPELIVEPVPPGQAIVRWDTTDWPPSDATCVVVELRALAPQTPGPFRLVGIQAPVPRGCLDTTVGYGAHVEYRVYAANESERSPYSPVTIIQIPTSSPVNPTGSSFPRCGLGRAINTIVPSPSQTPPGQLPAGGGPPGNDDADLLVLGAVILLLSGVGSAFVLACKRTRG